MTSFYPGVGPVPIEIVAEENHERRRIPWSVKLGMRLTGLRAQVNRMSNSNRVSIEGETIYYGPQLIGYLPEESPRPNHLYELVVSGQNPNQQQTEYRFYFWLTECGFRFPESCQPDEACPLSSTYCESTGQGEWHGLCRWRGGVPLNQRCDDTPSGACEEGVCVTNQFSVSNEKYCRALCDIDFVNTQNPCFMLCPFDDHQHLTEDVYVCVPNND